MRDVYQQVTDSIVAALEKGVRPWTRPWAAPEGQSFGSLPIRSKGIAYQGINVWLLWATAAEKGYTNPQWMTFKQALGLSAAVRKGEKSTMVVFYKTLSKIETNAKGEDVARNIPLLRAYNVFNVEQIDGLPERFYNKPEPVEVTPRARLERVQRCEAYFAASQSKISHGGLRAFYAPSVDAIQMPDFDKFIDAESYYATLGHEHIHWSGAESRLKREFGKRFGDDAYAAEELVAEMGSAFICATLGLALVPREDHASYLEHWIKVLKADKRAIFTASSEAQRAVEFLNKFSGVELAPEVTEEPELKAA